MTPLSEKELQELRRLELKKYAEFPLFHLDKISFILSNIVPKLIDVAEAHAQEKIVDTAFVDPKKVRKLKALLIHEKTHIASLENWITKFNEYANVRNEVFDSIDIPEEVIQVAPEVFVEKEIISWYKKIFRFFKGSK